ADGQLGMDDPTDPGTEGVEGHGDGGDQKGSVVGDDLDDAVLLFPALVLACRGVGAHLGAAGTAFGTEGTVGLGRAADLLGAAPDEFLGVCVPVVEGKEPADRVRIV